MNEGLRIIYYGYFMVPLSLVPAEDFSSSRFTRNYNLDGKKLIAYGFIEHPYSRIVSNKGAPI